jgi:hypothetical protein
MKKTPHKQTYNFLTSLHKSNFIKNIIQTKFKQTNKIKFGDKNSPQMTSILQETPLAELSPLNSLSAEQYSTFITILFEYLIGVPTNATQEPYEKFSLFLSTENLKKGFEGLFFNLIEFFMVSIKHRRSSEYIYTSTKNNSLQEDYVMQLKNAYGRHLTVITTLFDENVFKLTKLIDLEWKFGITTANSSLNTVGTCFLQLKLSTIQNGEKRDVVVEMTLSQFYDFLTKLQQAATEIQQA